MRFFLTIDVEDWFQVENMREAISRNSWSYREFSIIKNTYRLLDILNYNQI